MVKLICVGCSSNVYLRANDPSDISVESKSSSTADEEITSETYFLCPLCSPRSGEIIGAEEGKYMVRMDPSTLRGSLMGRNFYDLALAVCQECKTFYTMSVLDHGLADIGVTPLATYVVTCPVCAGKGKFRVHYRAARVLEGQVEGYASFKVVQSFDKTVQVSPSLPTYQDDEDGDFVELTKEEWDEYVLEGILSTLEGVQSDQGELLVTTRRKVAEALYISASTAARYLKKLVQKGVFSEVREGSTLYYIKQE